MLIRQMSYVKIMHFRLYRMAPKWEGGGVGGGLGMRDALHAFSLFPWSAVLSLLIPWQTLMRLQLPGCANSTSIIHPVRLHSVNTPHRYPVHNMHAVCPS